MRTLQEVLRGSFSLLRSLSVVVVVVFLCRASKETGAEVLSWYNRSFEKLWILQSQPCVHCFERSDWADIISFKIIIVHHHKSRAILIFFSVKTKMIIYRWWYLTFTCLNPYRLRSLSQVKPEHKEFSMGVASMADSCGIALAGVTALPVHNALCSNWRSRIRWRGCSCAGFQMRVWKNFMENFCIFALLTHLPPPKQCNLAWISIDSFIFTITTFKSKYGLFKVKCFRESCVHLLTWERNLYLYLKDSTVI